jgi:hypothetical protein
MPGKNQADKRKVLVYDFWAYDIATDVAKETLENLGIPFEVETRRKLRDPSAPEGCKYDDWAEIYVDVDRLVKWVEEKIESEINGF